MKVETVQAPRGAAAKRMEKRKAVLESRGKIALVKLPKFKLVIQKGSNPKTEVTSSDKKSDASATSKATAKATNYISKERMKRFLRMTRADLPRPSPKTYACERDIKLLKAPKDTIRCTACGVLYERVKRNEHLKDCKKTVSEQHKYACASCNFKHADIHEIEVHVETTHKKKTGSAATTSAT